MLLPTIADCTSTCLNDVQRKPNSPAAQAIRDYKGQSGQMITMAFLEEGGDVDVTIQVQLFPPSKT